MGGLCPCPSWSSIKRDRFKQFEVEPGWSDAVLEEDFLSMKYLYADDDSLLDTVVTADGELAIHKSAECGNYDMVCWLCQVGADINAQAPRSGWTALHYAAAKGDVMSVRALLSFGADYAKVDSEGLRAYEVGSASMRKEFRPGVVRDLIHKRSEKTPLLATDSTRVNVFWEKEEVKKERRHAGNFAEPQTRFAADSGVEMDFVAQYFDKTKSKTEFWQRVLGDATRVTKDRNLYKLVYLICTAALRKKSDSQATNMPKESVRMVTKALKIKFKTRGKLFELTKSKYLENMHNVLFEIHDEWAVGFDYKRYRDDDGF